MASGSNWIVWCWGNRSVVAAAGNLLYSDYNSKLCIPLTVKTLFALEFKIDILQIKVNFSLCVILYTF